MNRTPDAIGANDQTVERCAAKTTEVVVPQLATAVVRVTSPRSALPRYLLAGLTSSSAAHAGAAVLASVLLNGYVLRVAPPRQGVSSTASAPSALVLEAAWSDDKREQQPAAEPIAMAAARHETVVNARPVPMARQGELPTAEGAERQALTPELAPTSVRAKLPERNRPDEPVPPQDSPDSPPTPKRRSGRRMPDVPVIAAAIESRAAPASAESQGAKTDAPLQPLFNPSPLYPPDALAARLEGRVVLRVKVDPHGRVAAASILTSSRVPSLDQAALAAVRQWRFSTPRRAGVPVSTEVAVPIRFVIQ